MNLHIWMLAYGLQNTENNVGNLYSKNLTITFTEKLKGKKSLDSKVWKLPSSIGGTAWRRGSPEVRRTRSGHQGSNPVEGFAGEAREAAGAVEVEREGWGGRTGLYEPFTPTFLGYNRHAAKPDDPVQCCTG